MTSLHCIEVSAEGDRVWVNGHDGSCIGRFSKRFGIDVHRTVAEQIEGADQCLYCTHEPAGIAEWEDFREAMRRHHGIDKAGEFNCLLRQGKGAMGFCLDVSARARVERFRRSRGRCAVRSLNN